MSINASIFKIVMVLKRFDGGGSIEDNLFLI